MKIFDGFVVDLDMVCQLLVHYQQFTRQKYKTNIFSTSRNHRIIFIVIQRIYIFLNCDKAIHLKLGSPFWVALSAYFNKMTVASYCLAEIRHKKNSKQNKNLTEQFHFCIFLLCISIGTCLRKNTYIPY